MGDLVKVKKTFKFPSQANSIISGTEWGHICFQFSELLEFCKYYNQLVRDQEMKKEMFNNFMKAWGIWLKWNRNSSHACLSFQGTIIVILHISTDNFLPINILPRDVRFIFYSNLKIKKMKFLWKSAYGIQGISSLSPETFIPQSTWVMSSRAWFIRFPFELGTFSMSSQWISFLLNLSIVSTCGLLPNPLLDICTYITVALNLQNNFTGEVKSWFSDITVTYSWLYK